MRSDANQKDNKDDPGKNIREGGSQTGEQQSRICYEKQDWSFDQPISQTLIYFCKLLYGVVELI